jgi:hypothetical protein
MAAWVNANSSWDRQLNYWKALSNASMAFLWENRFDTAILYTTIALSARNTNFLDLLLLIYQEMFIEDRSMMNPLSILDFPEAKGQQEIYVRVDGPIPMESKK